MINAAARPRSRCLMFSGPTLLLHFLFRKNKQMSSPAPCRPPPPLHFTLESLKPTDQWRSREGLRMRNKGLKKRSPQLIQKKTHPSMHQNRSLQWIVLTRLVPRHYISSIVTSYSGKRCYFLQWRAASSHRPVSYCC